MISRTLSEKLRGARLSQRQLSDQLDQLSFMSPLLARQRKQEAASEKPSRDPRGLLTEADAGGASAAGGVATAAEGRPKETSAAAAAAAEVQALLDRGTRYEKQIAKLERSLDQRDRELQTVKSVIVYGAVVAILGLLGVFNNVPGFDELPRISIGVQQKWLDLPFSL